MRFRDLVRADLDAAGFGWAVALRRLPQLDGFWLALLHRVAHELFKRRVPWLPHVLGWGVARVIFAAEINPACDIGPGVRFRHTTGVVLGPARIGARCRIYQNVTVGVGGENDPSLPVIGDDVTIYAGAVIAGAVTIPSGAVIPANRLVTASGLRAGRGVEQPEQQPDQG